MAKKSKKLEEIKDMVKDINIDYDKLDLSVLNNFTAITKRLNDSRVEYKIKHKMSDIVMITLLSYFSKRRYLG